jgi:hypothetical protein
MARTALDLFGIAPPPHMEGKALFQPGAPSVEREVAA